MEIHDHRVHRCGCGDVGILSKISWCGYGSIPIKIPFVRGMNIHVFTSYFDVNRRYQGFDPSPIIKSHPKVVTPSMLHSLAAHCDPEASCPGSWSSPFPLAPWRNGETNWKITIIFTKKHPQKCHKNATSTFHKKPTLKPPTFREKKTQRVFPKFQAFRDLLDLFGFRFRAIEIWVEPAPRDSSMARFGLGSSDQFSCQNWDCLTMIS
jgi:hypothetical protein